MNALWSQLDRFTNASASDPFYCLHKPDGSFSLLTAPLHDKWAQLHKDDAVYYYYDEEYMQDFDLIEDISSRAFIFVEPEVMSELLQKRYFTLYPYTSHGAILKSWATTANIAVHFFKFFSCCKEDESDLPWPHPAFEAIETILKSRCKDEPLAKEALNIMDSLCNKDLHDENSGSTTSVDQER